MCESLRCGSRRNNVEHDGGSSGSPAAQPHQLDCVPVQQSGDLETQGPLSWREKRQRVANALEVLDLVVCLRGSTAGSFVDGAAKPNRSGCKRAPLALACAASASVAGWRPLPRYRPGISTRLCPDMITSSDIGIPFAAVHRREHLRTEGKAANTFSRRRAARATSRSSVE
jgi:hypothetical protein